MHADIDSLRHFSWLRVEVEQRLAEQGQKPEARLTRDEVWRRVDERLRDQWRESRE